MRLEARQRPLVAGVAAIAGLAAVLLYSLRGAGPSVDPVSLPSPPPAPQPAAATVAAQPTTAPNVSAEGLRLHGVMGAGAVIADAGGGQRFVAIGRDLRPGLTLERVGIDHVLLRSGVALIRLDFIGPAAAGPAAVTAPSADAAIRDETLRYRLGLAPRQQNGQVTGHVVRPGAGIPALDRAGIRPGDVILSVNGSRFDQERLLELAWTLANSDSVAFEIERAGRRISLAGTGSLR